MASKKCVVCDRCGREFDKNERYHSNHTGKEAFKIVGVATLRNGRFKEAEFDLCDKCLEAFFDFMGGAVR